MHRQNIDIDSEPCSIHPVVQTLLSVVGRTIAKLSVADATR